MRALEYCRLKLQVLFYGMLLFLRIQPLFTLTGEILYGKLHFLCIEGKVEIVSEKGHLRPNPHSQLNSLFY